MTTRPSARAIAFWHMTGPAQMPPDGAFVALVPGECAPVYPLDLPQSLRDTVRQQIAHSQIEGLLHEPLTDLDIRVGGGGRDAAALVVQADLANKWRQQLAPVEGRLRAVLPDYLALPVVEDAWVMQVADDQTPRLLVRFAAQDGFSAPLPLAVAQLRARLRLVPAPDRACIMGQAPPALRQLLEDAGIELADLEPEGAALAHGELAFNLYRDPAADRRDMATVLARWRMPLGLVLAGLMAIAGALWVDTDRLKAAAAARQTAAIQVAREAFLPQGPILNLRQQVGRVIAQRQSFNTAAGQQTGPLEILNMAAGVVVAQGAIVRRVQQTQRNPLRLELAVSDFAALERMTAELGAVGIGSRVVTSSAEPGAGVVAMLELTGGRAGGQND